MNDYKGKHLIIKKAIGSYTHHGLGLGGGRVIHYSGLADDLVSAGVIEEVSIENFSKDKEIIVKEHEGRRFDIEEATNRNHYRQPCKKSDADKENNRPQIYPKLHI